MQSHSTDTDTEEVLVSPLASPIVIPNTIHLPFDKAAALPIPAPQVFVIEETIHMKNMQQPIPSSQPQTPTTPTTINTLSQTIKRPRQSMSSLRELESNHLIKLEGTLQEIKKATSNGSQDRLKRKRNLKSPSEWSANSSIPENSEDLSHLRDELDRAESVYSKRTADATFGDEFSSSDDDDEVIAGSFLPIHSFEEYKDDDPAGPLTNHVPSPLRINTRTISDSTLIEGIPNTSNSTTPQSRPSIQNSNSLLSFPHTMETVSEEKMEGIVIQGKSATITPSNKTTKPIEDESTQETSPDSSNHVPHEVFVHKGSSASTTRTVVSTTTFEADLPPPQTPNPKDRLTLVPTTPIQWSGSATVAEARPSFTAPQPQRRHSSFSLMGHSPASFLKSAQSPVHALVKKQERKRLHLKATIDSVRSKNYSVDSRLLHVLTEKENLQRDMEADKIAHKQTVTSLENKIKFLQRQHELQTEQQEGVHGLTKTHNKFLKEQLDQLQEEYERLQRQHKKEVARLAEEPVELQEQIQMLESKRKLVQEKHEQELTQKQMEYESLEAKLKNLQEQRSRHEQSLQEELQEEHSKLKKLQDRLVELETVELTIAKQKIIVLEDQLEHARQERQDLTAKHRAALSQEQDQYAALKQQHATDAQASKQEISALTHKVSELAASLQQLESLRAKEFEERRVLETKLEEAYHQEQESKNAKSSLQSSHDQLHATLQTVQQERDALLQSQQEQAQIQEQMKISLSEKVTCLEEECARLQSTLDDGIANQTSEITMLRGKLDLAETEWHAQQATCAELQEMVASLKQEREELKASHKADLDKVANANATLTRNLMRDLNFGL